MRKENNFHVYLKLPADDKYKIPSPVSIFGLPAIHRVPETFVIAVAFLDRPAHLGFLANPRARETLFRLVIPLPSTGCGQTPPEACYASTGRPNPPRKRDGPPPNARLKRVSRWGELKISTNRGHGAG